MGKKRDRRWHKKQAWYRKTEKRKNKRSRRGGSPGDYTYRANWSDLHHVRAKSRGGDRSPENLLRMDRHRHNAYHLLFSTMSFLDVIRLLLRVLRIKNHPDYPQAIEEFENELLCEMPHEAGCKTESDY